MQLMNEPWFGDIVKHPTLLTKGGEAERINLTPFFKRLHDVIRKEDPSTPVLYAPAEPNNRFMRHVGYEAGFLPGEPMAFHVYCITGTDGPGPTTPATKELCHINDGFQLKNRVSDLKRLKTAGFVTEFGGVSGVTGLAEVRFVLEHMDAATPPLSWVYWAGVPDAAYQKELARPYPRAVAGDIEYMSFDQDTAVFELRFSPRDAPVGGPAAVRGEDTAGDTTGDTELFLSPLVYPNTAWNVTTLPADCCTVTPVANGVTLRVVKAAPNGVTVKVGPK